MCAVTLYNGQCWRSVYTSVTKHTHTNNALCSDRVAVMSAGDRNFPAPLWSSRTTLYFYMQFETTL